RPPILNPLQSMVTLLAAISTALPLACAVDRSPRRHQTPWVETTAGTLSMNPVHVREVSAWADATSAASRQADRARARASERDRGMGGRFMGFPRMGWTRSSSLVAQSRHVAAGRGAAGVRRAEAVDGVAGADRAEAETVAVGAGRRVARVEEVVLHDRAGDGQDAHGLAAVARDQVLDDVATRGLAGAQQANADHVAALGRIHAVDRVVEHHRGAEDPVAGDRRERRGAARVEDPVAAHQVVVAAGL